MRRNCVKFHASVWIPMEKRITDWRVACSRHRDSKVQAIVKLQHRCCASVKHVELDCGFIPNKKSKIIKVKRAAVAQFYASYLQCGRPGFDSQPKHNHRTQGILTVGPKPRKLVPSWMRIGWLTVVTPWQGRIAIQTASAPRYPENILSGDPYWILSLVTKANLN